MTPTGDRAVFAIASRKGADGRRLAQWVEERGYGDVTWIDPRDVDEVERFIREGRRVHVVLPAGDALLSAAWSGRLTPSLWRDVPIEIADEASRLSPDALSYVLTHWESWQRDARGRGLVAAVILSLLAIVAASVVLWVGLG